MIIIGKNWIVIGVFINEEQQVCEIVIISRGVLVVCHI